MASDEQDRLIDNIAGSLSQVSRDDIIERAVASFRSADPTYGDRVAAAVADLREGKSGEAGAEEAPDTTGGF